MMPQRKKELLCRKVGVRKNCGKQSAYLMQPTMHDVFFSKIVFWSALLVIVFANLLVSLPLIPFLIALNSIVLYSIVALLGATIGFLYNFLITDIGLLEKKHHRATSIIVPLIGVANVVVMVLVSNKFIESLKLNNPPHSPWFIALAFCAAFILPYGIDQLRLALKK